MQDFNNFLKSALNEPQRKAVEQKSGALLVTAGAGSGKTRVITARIAHLILNENVAPSTIVAMTFTNKAAGEMKARLIGFLGANHRLPFIGTFHAYCLLQLRANPHLLPFPSFSIMDADDQQSIIKKIIKKNSLNKYVSASQVGYQISQHKNKKMLSLQEDIFTYPYLREIYFEYENEKNNAHCFDFDDLIIQVVRLFQSNETFKTNFQNNIRHILVDEYQDTNHIQHLLLKCMGLDAQEKFNLDSLCAVGDEDQSIYSWRGATVTNMLNFANDFAPVTHVKIEQNYRSVQPILQVANKVIANNKLRNPKNLWSERQAKNRVVHGLCRSGEQEAEIASLFIKSFTTSNNSGEPTACPKNASKAFPLGEPPRDTFANPKSIAILYRTHYQSRVIEEALIYHSIPYKIIGGIRFYERKEIKDVLAYLRIIVNPHDKISLLRIINCPARGLGQKFEDDLLALWTQNPFSDFKQILQIMLDAENAGITPAKAKALINFLAIFENIDATTTPLQAIDQLLENVEYLAYLRNEYEPKEAEEKIENIRELRESATMFENDILIKKAQEGTNRTANLESFLSDIALMQEKIEKNDGDEQIPLMTLHAAKGLEFDAVILTGLEENLLPSSKSLTGNEELEEERRLFYVGITRAKDYLLLLSAGYRNTFGQIVDQIPSRFVSEIPKDLLQTKNFENEHNSQFRPFFDRWLGKQSSSPEIFTFGPARMPITQTPTKTPPKPSTTSGWRKDQKVRHAKFGFGIVTKVEKADGDDFYITAIFKNGQKTLLSSYLEKM